MGTQQDERSGQAAAGILLSRQVEETASRMRSAVKHLLFLVDSKKEQILRSAQDDIVGGISTDVPVLKR